jgi:PAS domain S-box-containing protein
MDEKLRSTGIKAAGRVPWGAHMCLFYQTRQELLSALVDYFIAGLENNELCVWITADPLIKSEARLALKRALPEPQTGQLSRYSNRGQLEIYDYKEWFVQSVGLEQPPADSQQPAANSQQGDLGNLGKADGQQPVAGEVAAENTAMPESSMLHPDRVFRSWVEKEKQARSMGFDGLRVSGDTSWLGVLFQDERPVAWDHEIWNGLALAQAAQLDTQPESRAASSKPANGAPSSDGPDKPDTAPLYTRPRILALCTYNLNQCMASDIVEATASHALSLIRKNGNGFEKTLLDSQPASPQIEWRLFSNTGFDGGEELRKKSEMAYRALVDSSPNHVFMLSPDGVYLTSNERLSQFGFERASQLIGKTLEEVYLPELAEMYRQQLERVLATGLPVEFEHPTFDARGEQTYWNTLYPIYRYGQVWAVGGACHNISQRKRTEQAFTELENERLRYQRLFEFAPDGMLVTDSQGVVLEANQAVSKMLNVWPEFLPGKALSHFIDKDDREAFASLLAGLHGEKINGRLRLRVMPRYGSHIGAPCSFKTDVAVVGERDTTGRLKRFYWLVREVGNGKTDSLAG